MRQTHQSIINNIQLIILNTLLKLFNFKANSSIFMRSCSAGLFFILLIIAGKLNAQAPGYEWAKNSSNSTLFTMGNSTTTDFAGNIYVTGFYQQSSITFGAFTLINSGGMDAFIVKYDASGNVIWAKSAGGTLNDYPKSISTDVTGNIYVTGFFTSATISFGANTLTNVSANKTDIFIVKYDLIGNVIWAKSAGGTLNDESTSINIDVSGNVVLTGFYQAPITFGSTTLSGGSFFLVKYDSSGNVIWAKSAGSAGSSRGNCTTTDPAGNVYVTGYYSSSTITFGAFILSNAGGSDLFIVKFDPLGNVVWAKSEGNTGSEEGTGIITDISGNVYLTGQFSSSSLNIGAFTLSNIGQLDIFIVKYDPSGNVLWAKGAGGISFEGSKSITRDLSGNVYLTGQFTSNLINFGSTTLNNADISSTTNDIFIVKYDPLGNLLWATRAGGASGDQGECIHIDAFGNIYLVGSYFSSVTFGTTTLTNVGGNDIFVVKFCGTSLNPSVSIVASTNNVCSGTSITITATPTNGGASPTYNFKVNGTTVQNTTSNTYTSTGFINSNAVTCVMTSNAPCASPATTTSNSVTININPSVVPAVAIVASTNNVCSGTSITITATPTNGGASPIYNFKVNGSTVQNTTSNTYTTTGFVNTDAVTCEMTSNATCPSPSIAISSAVSMIINNCAGVNAWTGAVSNVWSNTGNWSLGVLPGNGDDFLIPNSALQNPVISTNLAPIFNDITIESNRNLIVNTNGSINIDGILNNSGTITVNSGGSLVQTINSTLAGSGNYIVKRAIQSGQRFFGSPIQNQNVTTIGISATGSNGAQVIPVQTPSPFRCNADSVAANSPYGNIMEMNENAIPIDNCAQSLWSVKSSGNYSNGKGYAAYANGATTLNFSGTVNNGTVSYTGLTRQAGLIDQWSGPQTRGWHLVSNPYPSPIRLTNGDLGPDFDNAIYLFDGTSFSSVSLNVSDAVIAVGQGFQIRKSVVGGTADFTLNNSYREAGNPTFFSQNASITQYMNLVLTGNNQQKVAMIYFDGNASSAFDPQYDANCLFGVPNSSLIYTTEQNGELLSVDARPDLSSNPQQTIPVGIYDAMPGNFQLSFESISTIGQPVYLEDLKLNTLQQVTDSTIYPFTTVSGDSRDRFLLHFFGNPTAIDDKNDYQITLFPNPTNQNTSLLLNSGHGFNAIDVIDVAGRIVLSNTIKQSDNLITLNTLNLNAGVYFVKLMGASQQTIKFIKY